MFPRFIVVRLDHWPAIVLPFIFHGIIHASLNLVEEAHTISIFRADVISNVARFYTLRYNAVINRRISHSLRTSTFVIARRCLRPPIAFFPRSVASYTVERPKSCPCAYLDFEVCYIRSCRGDKEVTKRGGSMLPSSRFWPEKTRNTKFSLHRANIWTVVQHVFMRDVFLLLG